MANRANGAIVESVNDSRNDVTGASGNTPVASNNTSSDVDNGDSELIAGYESTDPATAAGTVTGTGDNGTGTSGRRRGRPPGSRNKSSASKETPKNLRSIETLLLSVHSMGAMILSSPGIELSESEASDLAEAIRNVAQYYPSGLSDKQLAWVQLGIVAGAIYGKRIVGVVKGDSKSDKKTANPASLGVVPQPAKQPTKQAANFPQILTPSQLFGANAGVVED